MIVVEKLKLAYFPVPKCACSSVKHALYEIINGEPYVDRSADQKMYLHKIYPTWDAFDELRWIYVSELEYTKICIVREPIDRLRSAYTNRVLFHNEINPVAVRHASIDHLPHKPTLEEFAVNLCEYQNIPSIRHHTLPVTHYLGEDSSRFDRIFNVSSMERFYSYLDDTSGSCVTRFHRQNGGRDIIVEPLSTETRAKIVAYYAKDYSAFGKYF
jgi:hypothetical protein